MNLKEAYKDKKDVEINLTTKINTIEEIKLEISRKWKELYYSKNSILYLGVRTEREIERLLATYGDGRIVINYDSENDVVSLDYRDKELRFRILSIKGSDIDYG